MEEDQTEMKLHVDDLHREDLIQNLEILRSTYKDRLDEEEFVLLKKACKSVVCEGVLEKGEEEFDKEFGDGCFQRVVDDMMTLDCFFVFEGNRSILLLGKEYTDFNDDKCLRYFTIMDLKLEGSDVHIHVLPSSTDHIGARMKKFKKKTLSSTTFALFSSNGVSFHDLVFASK